MNWLAWIALSNTGIWWLEYCYRTGKYENFVVALPYIIVPMMMGQVGLFYGFRGAPNLLIAGAVFTVINVGLRVVNTYLIGESINYINWIGVVLLVLATVLLKVK